MNNVEPGTSILTPFKKYESILNNTNEPFTKKADSVVEVWRNLSLCKFGNSDIQYVVQIIDWAKLHTLNIVLTGEWKKFKDDYEKPLLKEVQATQNQLTKINNAFFTRCQKLIDVIKNPWSDPTLEYLVRTPNAEIGPKEMEFFCIETAYLTSVRLKKLCESQCEDLALNLVKAFMKCYRLSHIENFNLNATATQVWFIFDIYVALLYKFKENDSLLDMLKSLSADEGLNLIKRFSKKRVKISKVWKNCHRIAILASQVFISSTILKPIDEIRCILKELLIVYVTLNNTETFMKDVVESVRSIIRLAETAAHIYVFCEVFQEQFESKMKAFTIELYIRALTTDMNLLERQKTDNDKDKVAETTKQLASGFTGLAEVLKSDINVSRECIMTAFSLEPTQERMRKIEELAKLSGFEVLDTGQAWKCRLHPPVLPTDDVTWVCNECGDYMCKPQLNVPLNTNTALNEALTEEKLGITRELCDDLVVLLSSPRYQVFSWLLNWPDLQRLCLMYLNDPERTKNVVTELKFLDIDYSIFATVKKEPLDEYAGIERGYEQFLDHEFDEDRMSNVSEDTGSQDSRIYSMSSDSASELHCLPFGPKKSDPNTLKSLRMFRPNLKRSRVNAETPVPEKIPRLESTDTYVPCSSQLGFSSLSPYGYPGNSIFGGNNFRQESASSSTPSPVSSIIDMSSTRNESPFWSSFTNNGGDLEKPFIPIKLHPPRQVNDVEPVSLVKPKEVLNNIEHRRPKQSEMQSKLCSYLMNKSKPEPEKFSKQKEPSVIVESIRNIMPIRLNHQTPAYASPNISSLEAMLSTQNLKTYRNNHSKTPDAKTIPTSELSPATQLMFDNLIAHSDTSSKNGQVATLQQVGGQVAIGNCSTKDLITMATIGNPNNCNSSETQLDQTTCSSSNLCSTSSESAQEHRTMEFAPIKETATVDSEISKMERYPNTRPIENQLTEEIIPVKSQTIADTVRECQNILPNTKLSEELSITKTSENSNLNAREQEGPSTDFSHNQLLENITVESSKISNTVGEQEMDVDIDVVEEIVGAESSEILDINTTELVVQNSPPVELNHESCVESTEGGQIQEINCSNGGTLNEVPNLFQDLDFEEPKVETPSQYVQVEIIEVEETKRDTSNMKSYVRKSRSREKPKRSVEELKWNFLLDKADESVISIDDTNDGYADTLINSDSEYDCFSSMNPLLHNVLNKIDSYERMKSNMNKENRFVQNDLNCINGTTTPHFDYINNKLFKFKESEFNVNKRILKKEPKYESCPDTGSDSQVELDSDDQYNKCYIELSRNNLLYDKVKGTFKNIDNYLKKCNNNNLNDLLLKRGKKSKKSCSSKKNRKFNTSDKTGLDIDSKMKPKKDITIKDVKVILERLPPKICESYLNRDASNPCNDKIQNNMKSEKHPETVSKENLKGIIMDIKNPRVVLERLSLTNNNYVRSVLSKVPGLHDTELIRPANTNMVVNVVQIAGGRTGTTVPSVNAQTSTQITPHIQRIGQPRVEKPQGEQTDNSETMVTSTVTSVSSSVKPSTSQPSTLINILSQQVIKPGQSSNCVRTRPTPLINIVSHQIIRPSNQAIPKMIASAAQASEQVINTTKSETVTEQTNIVNATAKNSQATVKSATVPTSTPGAILQFICKSATLPKFQQAFGKTVYQPNSSESSETTSAPDNSSTVETVKKSTTPTKNSTVNIQPIQGSVIYTRQVPVGQTINLIPPGSQVFRIATSNPDQISLVKDSVIHSKMSALLTAALQSKKSSESQAEAEGNSDNVERVTVARPALVQNARIVKPVIQIPTNVIRTSTNTQANLSSTTLEQLREFDMVYKQIKERSNTGTTSAESSIQSEPENSSQGISVTYLNQGQKFTQLSPVVVVSSYCNLQPAASPALSVTSQGSSSPCVTPASTPTLPKVSSKSSSKGKSLKNTPPHASKASPIPKPQQKPQEDEHTTQRIFDILAEYAEQLRNSPDLNNKPAPRRRSNPPTNPSHNSKRKKSSGTKKPSTSGSVISESDLEDQRTIGSEDSSCGVVQLSVKDDDAPQNQKTESNDSSSGATRTLLSGEAAPSAATTRNLIIADSSVGEALKLQNTAVLVPGNYIMPVSMVKGGQQIAVVSGGSKILATVPARSGPNMLLFQSFLNQNRKPGVPTVKYSTLQPLSGLSSQNIAGVSGQSQVILPQNAHNLTAVTLGQPLTLKKVEDPENRVNTELLLAIAQPRNDTVSIAESGQQGEGVINVQNANSIKFDDNGVQANSAPGKVYTYQKSAPIATPVISQISHSKNDTEDGHTVSQPGGIITLNISSDKHKDEPTKTAKRVQSVLVTTCSSNGPMLSQTPPRYRKPSDATQVNNPLSLKGGYLNNGEKQKEEAKSFQTAPVYFPNKIKKVTATIRGEKELHQLSLQRKQAAIDRELRLQKSLSEECEDLGVDEPSTSDLFPEADLLFDSNHSPSFEQTAQDLGKKVVHQEKDKTITLFSDDDNFLFDSVQYQTECELQYEQSRQISNGQGVTGNESGSSCEDTTLLQNCASMSDVTLNSPISPEFNDNPTHINKYKFKYSNKKKTERHKQVETWVAGDEVSSSEDTMCSEMGKISHGPKSYVIKNSSCDEDEEFKFVRVSISKTDLAREEESCEEMHYEDDLDSPSGRGARRSVKKMCSCCNGSQEGNRKRPSSQSHTPALHKKAFLNKKR